MNVTGSVQTVSVIKRTQLTPWESSSREADSGSTNQKVPHITWEENIHFRAHKSA